MSEDPGKYLLYDDTSPEDIERFGRLLEKKSLRMVLPERAVTQYQAGVGKGNLGVVVERSYFQLDAGNSPEPDFAKAGVELKCTPLKLVRGKLRAKERLVLQKIDFMALANENWESSSFLKKNNLLLLMFYRWVKEQHTLDHIFEIVRLWSIPERDVAVIREDWRRISERVRKGEAHLISESETNYLAACTKAATSADRTKQPNSDEPAKPRAWSFKAGYMNSIISESLDSRRVLSDQELQSGQSLEQLISKKFDRFIGMTAEEIATALAIPLSKTAKNRFASLTKVILGKILGAADPKRVAEFEKADIIPRTIRLKQSGMPKEAVSFPAFDYIDLVNQAWDESDFRADLSKRFFFVIYRLDADETPTLVGVRFWGMPITEVDGPAQDCFVETQQRILAGRSNHLPTSKENPVCHVRPHGRDGNDKIPTPTGERVVRKSFWLNQRYLKRVLAELLSSG